MLLCFNLSSDEVASLDPPRPLFILAPRLAYITSFYGVIQQHFKEYVVCKGTSLPLWLSVSSDHRMIQWQLPIGKLFVLSCIIRCNV